MSDIITTIETRRDYRLLFIIAVVLWLGTSAVSIHDRIAVLETEDALAAETLRADSLAVENEDLLDTNLKLMKGFADERRARAAADLTLAQHDLAAFPLRLRNVFVTYRNDTLIFTGGKQ